MSFRKIFYYFVIIISSLVIIASLLSLFYDLPYWYSKVLDFPRLQYWILGLICLILFLGLNKKWDLPSVLLILGLLSSVSIHSIRIFPYWFGEKSVPDAVAEYDQEDSVGIMVANVLIKNRKSDKFLELVAARKPDMLLVMEVNDWWLLQLESLNENYPYVMKQPNEEAYGMALYSKFPLRDKQIKYLKHKNVPSFHTMVELPSGKNFMFHGVHPVAPMPSDKYPDNVGEAEVSLLRVGEMVSQEKLPAIVAGDFNDVSWSHTARLFGNDGNLKNVRIGRGLYNSFDAQSKIMRWPLDHYFVTEEFALVELEKLPEFSSDHFPMYAEFVLRDF
ncbi:endonuclease/exonuclease/phosphatase family protein [Salinimicrobium gaetbulicola]|uniref:Endonuclease/exonuclease/phosphatase family protein n=1 Tax=Salinimicrobium gaetbulicola TaxID=999702 RepID=A0ABW3II57_9FLAO